LSLPDDSDLVDPAQTRMKRPLGPVWSFRCNEFGHLCNINGTLQRVPRGPAMSNLQGCVSNETATGKLTHVTDEVAFLKALKGNPKPDPGLGDQRAGDAVQPGDDPVPHGHRAAPQHRALVHPEQRRVRRPRRPHPAMGRGLREQRVVQSICASSFGPALQVVANKIGGVFAPACVNGPFPMAAGAAHPACRVVDRSLNAAGARVETLVPSCLDNGNAPPCWTLQPDTTTACRDGQRLAINRAASLAAWPHGRVQLHPLRGGQPERLPLKLKARRAR